MKQTFFGPYRITEKLDVGKAEFVLGESGAEFITIRHRKGCRFYFSPHRFYDRNSAVDDLIRRTVDYLGEIHNRENEKENRKSLTAVAVG